MVKIRVAAFAAESDKEKAAIVKTGSAEDVGQNNITDPNKQAEVVKQNLKAAGLGDAAKNEKTVAALVNTLEPSGEASTTDTSAIVDQATNTTEQNLETQNVDPTQANPKALKDLAQNNVEKIDPNDLRRFQR